jgi:hypothetical protein
LKALLGNDIGTKMQENVTFANIISDSNVLLNGNKFTGALSRVESMWYNNNVESDGGYNSIYSTSLTNTTNQNDYVVSLSDYKIVVANDDSSKKRSFLINEDIEFENAYVLDQKGKFLSEEVIVVDSNTLDTIFIVKSNENGYVSFIKPDKPYYLIARKYGHIGFFSQDNSQIILQNTEDLFETKQFYLLDSPFNEKKLTEITPKGKRELEYLAKSLKETQYITTISVHVHSVSKTEKAQEISDKQVKVITDILLKNGVNKDNIIVASYANSSPLIGWEGKDRIEIGFLLEK